MKTDNCGERLKRLREDWGLNMKQMAQKLNMPYTTYVGYEKNEREPNLKTLALLAVCFGVSVDYLVGISDDPTITSKSAGVSREELLLLNKYRALDEFGKEAVNAVLNIEYSRATNK